MVGENSQLPTGATPVDQNTNTQTAQGVPQGAAPVDMDAYNYAKENSPSFDPSQPISPIDVGKGFLEGAGSTITGMGRMAEHVLPQKASHLLGIDQWTSDKMKQRETPSSLGEMVGYGGETLGELLLGDFAIKGLPLAERFSAAANASKTLQKFPNLLNYIKLGANVARVSADLSPEELEFLRVHPTLAKLAGIGNEALKSETLRQGALVGGQTQIRTGDPKQALEQGGAAALLTGALGTGAELLGKGGDVAGKLSETAEKTADVIKSGQEVAGELEVAPKPLSSEISSDLKKSLKDRENQVHQQYEDDINKFKDTWKNTSVDPKNAPLAKTAKNVLGQTDKTLHPYEEAGKEALNEGLKPKIREWVDLMSKGEMPQEESEAESKILDASGKPIQKEVEPKQIKPLTVDNLVSVRQMLRKAAQNFDYGDVNARVLRKMISGVDDTIKEMAGPSGAAQYDQIRANYRDNIKYFDPNQPESKIIEKIESGRGKEVLDDLFQGGGDKALARVKDLKTALNNPEEMKDLAKQSGLLKIDKFVDPNTGKLDAIGYVKSWYNDMKKSPEAVKEFYGDLFQDKQTQIQTLDIMNQLQKKIAVRTGQIVPIFSKTGGAITGGILGATGGAITGGAPGAVLGDVIGHAIGYGLAAGGTKLATYVGDELAKNPEFLLKLAKSSEGLSKTAESLKNTINIQKPLIAKGLQSTVEPIRQKSDVQKRSDIEQTYLGAGAALQ